MAADPENSKVSNKDIQKYRGQLLAWYDLHRRDIPWRRKPGAASNPYHIWLSEIMCQQTTVQAVKAYYLKFLDLWPTVHDLAAAGQEDIMAAWAGLGYYARARNLHKCAQIVVTDFDGIFPNDQEELKKLPGVGDYTSAAITAIAFNKPATVVDGNVERVMSRLFAVEDPLPKSKKTLKALAHRFYKTFAERPGDLAQSFMDLGATVCIPKVPRCDKCPLNKGCIARTKGIQAKLPNKVKKGERLTRYGNVYWITNDTGDVLFHQRPNKGLLGGMIGLPTSNWEKEEQGLEHPEFLQNTKAGNLSVFHTFTHFDLELRLYRGELLDLNPDLFWSDPLKQSEKLPTVFRKAFDIVHIQ